MTPGRVPELLWRWGPPALTMVVFWINASRPSAGGPDAYGVDKVMHALAYGVLGLLLRRAIGREASASQVLAVITVGVLAGAADEWIQGHVPGRNGSVWDLLADAVGIVGGVALGRSFWTRRWARRLAT